MGTFYQTWHRAGPTRVPDELTPDSIAMLPCLTTEASAGLHQHGSSAITANSYSAGVASVAVLAEDSQSVFDGQYIRPTRTNPTASLADDLPAHSVEFLKPNLNIVGIQGEKQPA